MKKQRPHKTHKASKRVRKAKLPDVVAPKSLSDAGSADRKQRAADAVWAWHSAAMHGDGAPGRRAKGPPPKREGKRNKQKKVDAQPGGSRATKLAPELVAFVDALTGVSLQTSSRPRWTGGMASRGREERVAALALLLSTLLMAGVLTVGARHARPSRDTTAAVAILRGPMSTMPARGQTKIAPVSIARSTPPMSRPGDPLVADVPETVRDLDLVTVALAGDASRAVAMAGPPFARVPERAMSTVPVAVHDLDVASEALKDDAARAVASVRLTSGWPVYSRRPEAATQTVPTAVHDLATAVAAMARDAVTSAAPPSITAEQPAPAIAETPFGRMPEGTLFSALPQAEDRGGDAEAAMCRPKATWQARFAQTLKSSAFGTDATASETFGLELAAAAKAQIGDIVIYNAQYMTIAYPRGDVPDQFGVCTDVVIRAYRALGIDLQELVHLSRPGHSDPSIDHRRTELLRQFFATHGEQLATSPYIEDYLPGDIVTYYRPQNKSSQSHIAIVSDVMARSGRPMIVHNRGWGVQLEDALFVDQMTGHYRFRAPQSAGVLVARNTSSSPNTADGDAHKMQVRAKGGRRTAAVQLASARMIPTGAPRRAVQGAASVAAEKPSVCSGQTPSGGLTKSCPAP